MYKNKRREGFTPLAFNSLIRTFRYADLTTAPERIQRVQTFVLFLLPLAVAIRTVFRLGSHRRLVLLCAWDTLFPVIGPLPQTSHTLAIVFSFY